MTVADEAQAIPELNRSSASMLTDEDLLAETPWVARGLASSWPIVTEGRISRELGLQHLLQFYQGKPVNAFLAEPEVNGRFFYNETIDGFNFVQLSTQLNQVVDKLLEIQDDLAPPALYVGSTNVDAWLPGFRALNDLRLERLNPLVSLWLGNRSRIAPHFDFPRNLACCVIGCRDFLLFPPDQVGNLYMGPWDHTPAGQPVSMVDPVSPDFDRYPRYRLALEKAVHTRLYPGDVIYIPGMWWHGVTARDSINALVNYWWSETPAVYGSPADALLHSILSIGQLPRAQKLAWQALFEATVFSCADKPLGHLPEDRHGILGGVSETKARQLRTELINKLRR